MDIDTGLTGKVALVTGGSRGIGAAIAHRLAADGADVALGYRTDADAAERVAAAVRGLGRRAVAIRADLAEPDAAEHLVAAATGAFGALDILVNNAGVTHWGSIADTTVTDIDNVLAVDARAPFLLLRAAFDRIGDGGRIVNIASGVTHTPLAGIGLYTGAKAFLDHLTKVAAIEFAPRRITVNAVGPGATATGPFAFLTEAQRAVAGEAFALGRIGEPEDTAAVVAFLASRAAGFVTGQVIYCAGGQHGPIRWSA